MTAEEFKIGSLYFSVIYGGLKLIVGGSQQCPEFRHINATPLIHRAAPRQSSRIKAHAPQLSTPGNRILYSLLPEIRLFAGTDDDVQVGDTLELYEEGDVDRYRIIHTAEPKPGLLDIIGELIQ